jgi:hypothetical protein
VELMVWVRKQRRKGSLGVIGPGKVPKLVEFIPKLMDA